MTNYDNLFSKPIDNLGDWTFNDCVAEVFPNMTQRSIPGYSNIISIIGMMSNRFARPGTQIYDLGCALGAATQVMCHTIHHNDCRIIAVDNSPSMIERCRRHISSIQTMIPTEIVESDICTISIENASLVVLNFTMQFIKLVHRQTLLNRIYAGLNLGGALILSEKFSFDDHCINELLFNMHHDFKLANGYSKLEINQKHSMLKNVMLTDTIEVHKQRLTEAGFNHIELFFQYFNFGSLIAIKSKS
ncbi:tRNA (cmo5U34)-methyltransferase [Candidatus Gullanella endobia]|uniref:Carboxy-S-adenosyl-L-methionine synthase n=1 Tax=Candidatus Gullanella endobia TaxID=1070130 RepID=A0A143WSZ9_9ENTR|nr:carboxy-S-adenosyl-L-methionine synthase CmoA [Candidatus Gullanella endobia]CUX95999.1 tRNA (cmo5U34)-methyltransferase [Candidatus Gullanella endobia]